MLTTRLGQSRLTRIPGSTRVDPIPLCAYGDGGESFIGFQGDISHIPPWMSATGTVSSPQHPVHTREIPRVWERAGPSQEDRFTSPTDPAVNPPGHTSPAICLTG
ncbi:hypothetical protein GCM10009555_098910 [Acrocarpospora macrocephala]